MKVLSKIFQVLAAIFGLTALVLFFTNFVNINGGEITGLGAQFAFGSEISVGTGAINMARSSKLLFAFLLGILAFGLNVSTFFVKSNGVKYWAPGIALADGIYMLVIALSNPMKFIDLRPLADVVSIEYTKSVLLSAIALFVAAVFGIVYLLIFDYLEVLASKGAKLPLPKRIARFFRDYKSELKKIVWPTFPKVVKNTIIVLAVCLVVGIFVWVLDFGLAKLLNLLVGLKKG